jgi:hypothetical protein
MRNFDGQPQINLEKTSLKASVFVKELLSETNVLPF